ncbi:MAG TPA: response regulator [Desulfobacteraceae bacterium]|nr:response regulator [Desulfobacteraceae bacterium]
MSSENRQVLQKRTACCEKGFCIFVPVSDDASHDRDIKVGQPEVDSQAQMPAHILVVDDEKNLLHIWKDMLRHFGYEVTTALSGEEAIEVFRGVGPDLVILDMNMPGMGGLSCLEHLIQMDPSVRVIISSGHDEDAEVEKAFKLGARGFLGKPFTVDSLLSEIRKTLD